MKPNDPELILHFFVTQDSKGEPRQLEIHLLPEKEVWMANQRFTEYLWRQREMYKPSLIQSHLPDLDLCCYQFPAEVTCPDIRPFDKDNSLVHKFISENGGSMQNNVPLRGLEYLYSRDEEKSLPMLVSNGLADHLLIHPEAKRFALAQDTLHDGPSETLTAVETAAGVLLFEYSGYGRACCQSYMQHLADHFFIASEQNPEFVNLYKLTRPDTEVVKAFHTSRNAFSLYTNFFLPDKAQYQDATILRNARLDRSHRIEPTFDAFKQFTEDYQLLVTPKNAEIFNLLFIREYGLPADFNSNESYKEFAYKGDFKPLEQEMSELQSQKGYSEKAFYNIQNRQQQLADKILGLAYKLTCPPLQLTGPAMSEKKKAVPRRNKSHNPRI